jgi:hypothetical protein
MVASCRIKQRCMHAVMLQVARNVVLAFSIFTSVRLNVRNYCQQSDLSLLELSLMFGLYRPKLYNTVRTISYEVNVSFLESL